MAKVQQKFFKTAGGISFDQGISLSTNCQRVFVAGSVGGVTAADFCGHVFNTINANEFDTSDAVIAGLDRNGCQKFFKIAGRPNSVALSSNVISNCENVFVAGIIAGPTAINFAGNEITVNSSDEGFFMAKLDNCGHQNFFITAGTTPPVQVSAPKITKNSQRLFITATLGGAEATDFNGTIHPLQDDPSVSVAGLDYRGHQKFFVTAGGEPRAITSDECHVVVTGFVNGPTATDFAGNIISTYGNADIFVAGLSNCGTQKFYKHAGAPNILTEGGSIGNSIHTSCGDIFITGSLFSENGTAINFNGDIVATYGDHDIFVAKLNSCGDQKFFKVAGGLNSDRGNSLISNEHGVFITGVIAGPTATDFNGREITKLYGSSDIFVAGLSRGGKQKFFKTAGSIGNDNGLNITANDQGIFVTGFIFGATATDFNGCPVKHLYGGSDIFVAKLDFCGHQEFFLTAGSVFFEQGNKIEVRDNEIYVTGTISGVTGSDFCNHSVKHLQGQGDIFVARLDDLCAKFRSKFSSMPYVPR